MSERVKDWIYYYFCIGFFWSFFSTMMLLAINSTNMAAPTASVEVLIFFIASWAVWPAGIGFAITLFF